MRHVTSAPRIRADVVAVSQLCLLLISSFVQAPAAANLSAGSVKAMIPDASRNARPLTVNDTLEWNDLLQTDAKGRVRAGLNDGSILSLGSNSQLRIVQHDAAAQQTAIDLSYGKLRNQVTKITQPQGKYQVKTANAVIGVIGTDFYVDYVKERTTVICYEGVVSVLPLEGAKVLGSTNVASQPDGSILLKAGQIVIIGPAIARDETLLYPVLMQAGKEDTEVAPPGTSTSARAPAGQGTRAGSGSSAGTRTSAAPKAITVVRTNDEDQLVDMINETRAEKGVPPLAVDPRLTEAARTHTRMMIETGELSHQFPGEPSPADRITQQKVSFDAAAENIGWDVDVVETHYSLIADPPHLRNILDPKFNVIGVAVIRSGDHVYVTEDFAHTVKPK